MCNVMQVDETLALGSSTRWSAPPEMASAACDLRSGTHSAAELEEGEIPESPSPRSILCVEDVMSSLQGQESLSQTGILSSENLPNTHNCAADQELRGHLKSTSNG